MLNNRLRLAQCLIATGGNRLIGGPEPGALLVVNYHRLRPSGQSGPTRFDDGVFDTDLDTFRRQMQWLKSATIVLDEEGLLAAGQGFRNGGLYSAVTFDDGYVDCYRLAKPVLDEVGIRAIFFVPIEMLESRRLGWWDIAAYLMKQSRCDSIVVDGETYLLKDRLGQSLERILDLFKLQPADRTDALLAKLSAACRVAEPAKDLQSAELMTWAQIRELRAGGHAIGSHTLSHRVLATIRPEEQETEIRGSKRELEAILGASVASFAYPVGGAQHITQQSIALVELAGYRLAFTFNTGMAQLPLEHRYLIPRESATSFPILKAKALAPGVMGLQTRA